jgi:endo-1,4-beta-xylanase
MALAAGSRLGPSGVGFAHFAVSLPGLLIHRPRDPGELDRELGWVDRKGTVRPLADARRRYPEAAPLSRTLVLALLPLLGACGATSGPQAPSPLPTRAPAADPDPLRADAEATGRLVGAAIQSRLLAEAPYTRTLARHFDYVTAEWEMKWDPTERQDGVYDFAGADAIVAFAEANRMRVKGHALLWHEALPDWVKALPARELQAAVEDHIRTVVGRYRGRIVAWDVVNEAIADDGDGLRDTAFLQKLGEGYLELAFRVAREADPDVLLVYNDYGAEGLGRKSDAVYSLLRRLKERGAPVGGVGLQMHVAAQSRPPSADIAANMRRLGELGLLVNISEMDVRIRNVAGDLRTRLEVQRREYHDIVAVCVAEPRCHAVTFWGFTDRYSWVDDFFGPDDPLLFDENYAPKPAFFGVQDALRRR